MNKILVLTLCLIIYCTNHAQVQQIKINGTVTDNETNLPLQSATVTVKGTTKIILTDKDGKFTVQAKSNDVLVVTFTGYENRSVTINGRTILPIKLIKADTDLDEVIVVGYSTVRKKDIPGASTFLGEKDVQKASALSAAEVIQGRVPGVQVISTDGSPGGGITLNLRGSNSILAGTAPLLVIDGVPFVPPAEAGFNPFAIINPNDIESINVLKDASATAQYGAEAANGVILITTKKGKGGKPRININSSYSIGELKRFPQMMNSEQYSINMKQRIDNNPAIIINNPSFGGVNPWNKYIEDKIWEKNDWTNWLDAVKQPPTIQNVTLDISGASNTGGNYYFSGGYYDERGLLRGSGFKRYTAAAKFNQNIRDKLSFGLNINYAKTKYDGLINAWGGLNGQGLFNNALIQSPALPKNDPTGDSSLQDDPEFNANASGVIFNPFTYLNDVTQDRFTDFIQARADVKYNFNKRLSWKNSFSIQSEIRNANRFENANTRDGRINNGILEYRTYKRSLMVFQSQLNYNYKKDKHYLDANLIFEAKETKTDEFFQRLTNIAVQSLGFYGGVTSTLPQTGIRSFEAVSKASVVGIVNYTFDNRFIASLQIRADGSSNFGESNRWGYFPGGALAWRVTNEKFMSKLKGSWLDDLKIRTSFGINGNDQIPSYRTLATYALLSANGSAQQYPFYSGTAAQYGINVGASVLPNPNLKWEQTSQYNFGLDASLFKGRLSFSVDYYRKKTTNMLLERSVASYILPTNSVLLENRGTLENYGWEFETKGTIVKTKNFNWDAGFNISFNRNKVLFLGDNRYEFQFNGSGLDGRFFPIRVRVGEPLGNFYGMIQDGVVNNSLERANSPINTFNNALGALNFVDTNGDGILDRNDLTQVGSTLPVHIGGINTTLRYKNLDLYIFGRWSYGNDVINANFDQATEARYNNNVLAIMANQFWTTQTPNNNYFALGASNRNNLGVLISEYVEDGSFFRLDRITLGYSFDAKKMKKIGIQGLRFAMSAENAFVFTKYSWFDPEVNTGSGTSTRLGPGVDRSGYPRVRRLTFSLTCNL